MGAGELEVEVEEGVGETFLPCGPVRALALLRSYGGGAWKARGGQGRSG